MNMAPRLDAELSATDGRGKSLDQSAQPAGDPSGPARAASAPLRWRSLKFSFLAITLSSVFVILIAFFTYLETTQYRAAADQITEKLNRMLDSSSILLADATARKNEDDILLLLAPVLGDPDVVAVAVDLTGGKRLAAYGDPIEKIDPSMIMRRAITHIVEGLPARIGTFLVGRTHKRIDRDLEDRLRNDFILAILIFLAIVVSSYLSLRLTVMRPMRRLLSAIEGWEIDNDPKPVDWKRNDEFGQLISAFNQMQRRQQTSQDNLRVALDAAESADRAKTAFLAIIGHELRTPLNAIIGFSDFLKSQITNVEHGDYLKHINDSGHALLDMVNDILEITHIQAGSLTLSRQPIRLSALVDQVIGECRTKRPGDIARIDNTVSETLPPVTGDSARIARMLFHLVMNAVRFTAADGNIGIDARAVSDAIRITVTDTGCGMPKDKLTELRDPFIQVSSDWQTHGEGAGLGLTYVKNMVQCHGGRFELDSVEGEGTTVALTLLL